MNLHADLRHPVLHLERYDLDHAVAIDRAAVTLGLTPFDGAAPLLLLTPRQPWAPGGLLDFYAPGRWDCTSEQVLMSAIVQHGTPGDWDGTVGYGTVVSPGAGTYLVVLQFSGVDQTMSLRGPWGTNTAHTATVKDVGSLGALWTSAGGDTLSFSFSSVTDGGLPGLSVFRSLSVLAA